MNYWLQYGEDKVEAKSDADKIIVRRYRNDELLYTAAVYHYTQTIEAMCFASVLMAGIRGAF